MKRWHFSYIVIYNKYYTIYFFVRTGFKELIFYIYVLRYIGICVNNFRSHKNTRAFIHLHLDTIFDKILLYNKMFVMCIHAFYAKVHSNAILLERQGCIIAFVIRKIQFCICLFNSTYVTYYIKILEIISLMMVIFCELFKWEFYLIMFQSD